MSAIGGLLDGVLHKPWVSPGPVIDRLVLSTAAPSGDLRHRARVRVAIGPVGGGKSTGILGGTIINAMQQPRWPDGVRRYRLLVLREDYRKLWSQFLPFWLKWWPKDSPFVDFSGSTDNPVDFTLYMITPTGPVDYMVNMRALGQLTDPEAIRGFFAGYEPTDIWMEEGDLLAEAVYNNAILRLGRYPDAAYGGGAVTPTLWLGMNTPMIGSWPYRRIMSGKWQPNIQLFKQPGAFAPGAENKHNLRAGYYEDILANTEQRDIDRNVHCKYVLPISGKPVYPDYNDDVHTREIEPDPRLSLGIGMDCGLDPAAAFAQQDGRGQWRIVDEIALPHGSGEDDMANAINAKFAEPHLRPWSGQRKLLTCRVDPNASWGAAKGKLNWLQTVEKLTGLVIRPARSNKTEDRKAPMRRALQRLVGGEPGLIVSPRAKMIREGLGGMYHYTRVKVGDGSRYSDTPEKNAHSHPCEAGEYIVMETELEHVIGERQGSAPQRRQTQAITDDNPKGAYAET